MSDAIKRINDAQIPRAQAGNPGFGPYEDIESFKEKSAGTGLTPGQVINREYDQRGVDGVDPLQESRAPKPPSVYLGKGNPLIEGFERPSRASEHEAASALWTHYRNTLLGEDRHAAARLMTAFARTGQSLAEEAGVRESRAGTPDHAQVSQQLRDSGADAETASDRAEEIASLQSRIQTNGSDRFTITARTAGEAKVARHMVDWARALQKPRSNFEEATTLYSPRSLPDREIIEAGLASARPDPIAAREPDDQGRIAPKRVGVIAGKGAENAAVQATSQLDKDVELVPGKNAQLWRQLIDSNTHKRKPVGFTRGDYSAKSIKEDNMKAVDAADQVIVTWNGDDNDFALHAAAAADRKGKLAAVFDAEGNELDRDGIAAKSRGLHLSAKQYKQQQSASAFDVPANTPEGRLGLSLVRGMPRSGLEALSQTTLTLNEISEMAGNETGREQLYQNHRVPGRAISAMADPEATSNARESFERITDHCKKENVQVIGPESYPQSMLAKGSFPPVMYMKSNDPEGFRDLQKATAVVGDQNMHPTFARRASAINQAIDDAGIPTVRVEGHGAPENVPQTKNSVLILPSGHSHANKAARLDFADDGQGRQTAEGPSGRSWQIARGEDGKFNLHVSDHPDGPVATRDPKAELNTGNLSAEDRQKWETAQTYVVAREKQGKHEGLVPLATVKPDDLGDAIRSNPKAQHVMAMPSGLSRPVEDVQEERRRRALGAEHFAEQAQETLKGRAERSETKWIEAQVHNQRDAVVKAGGHVVSALPPQETGSVYNADIGKRIRLSSRATDTTRSEAQVRAVQIADAAVFTQIDARSSDSRDAIAMAAAKGVKMAAISPERGPEENVPEMGGNRAVLGRGRDVPRKLGLTGNKAEPFETRLADNKIAGPVSKGDEAAFVGRLKDKLENKPKARTAKRNAAEAEA